MFVTGFAGYWIIDGSTRVPLAQLKNAAYSTFASESLAVVPMFLLMGYFATIGGMSKALFKAAEALSATARVASAWPPLLPAPGSGRSAARRWRPRPPWAGWRCRNCGASAMTAGFRPHCWPPVGRWAS
jgi:DctM-like transporters.